MGAGVTIVAPGDPVAVVSDMLAVACGETRLRICANDGTGAKRTAPIAAAAKTAATPQRRIALKPHPDIAFFLELNHGNFMPPAARQAARNTIFELAAADSPPLSPYCGVRIVRALALADHG
jgi:hypothetical protein